MSYYEYTAKQRNKKFKLPYDCFAKRRAEKDGWNGKKTVHPLRLRQSIINYR